MTDTTENPVNETPIESVDPTLDTASVEATIETPSIEAIEAQGNPEITPVAQQATSWNVSTQTP